MPAKTWEEIGEYEGCAYGMRWRSNLESRDLLDDLLLSGRRDTVLGDRRSSDGGGGFRHYGERW